MSQKENYSEEELVAGIQQGDAHILRWVYKKNYPVIAHLLIQNNGTDQEAKDVFQEAMIVLYEKLQKDDFVLQCQIKTFLYSIARRQWLKRLAQKNKYVGQFNEKEEFIKIEIAEEQQIDEQEKQFEVMGFAMEQLGEPCKTILEDFYIQKLSMQEITEKMGYTNAENAKNQKYKCLNRLKKIFFNQYN